MLQRALLRETSSAMNREQRGESWLSVRGALPVPQALSLPLETKEKVGKGHPLSPTSRSVSMV